MFHKVSHRLHRGFTLIELLVVMSIIAILAGIIFPIFAQTRGAARQTQCGSNMAQLGKALMMYTQDNDGTYPDSRLATDALDGPGCSSIGQTAPAFGDALPASCWEDRLYAPGTGRSSHVPAGYAARILPYIKSDQVFRCPADSLTDRRINGSERLSYLYRHALDKYAAIRGSLREDMIPKSSQIAVLIEEGWHSGTSDPYFWTSTDRGPKPANVLYADGHVKLRKVDFVTGTNNISNYDVNWWFNGPGVEKNGDWDLSVTPAPTDVQ